MNQIRLGLEWFLNPDHVPFLVGLEKGWFEDEGIDLELVAPEEHFDALEEIEAGKMDFAITEPIHLVADRAKGQGVVGFARFLHTNGGVMYFSGRGIERPRDMVGKRLQYPGAPGPGGPAIVKTMVEADGLACSAEDFVPVNHGFFHTDALAQDKADLATLIFYNFEILEARGKGFPAEFFALKDWGVPDFCQLILITTEEVLHAKRSTAQALLRVLKRGIDFLHQHPEEAKAIYDRRTGADSGDAMGNAIFAATLPCFTYDLSMSPEYYLGLETWMRETGQTTTAVDPASCWTNDLAL